MLSAQRACRFCIIAVVALVPIRIDRASAQSPDSLPVVAGPLTLDRALVLARRHELRLRAAGVRADAARARVVDASRRPNPTVSATEENFGGSLGTDHRETSLTAGQTFELGGDRSAREATARAEHQLAVADAAIFGREGLALTAEHFIAAWSWQSRLDRLREGERLTREAIAAATERHRVGAVPRLEILRAESQARAQTIERRRAESELAVARQELALRWGASSAPFDSLVTPSRVASLDSTGWQRGLGAHPVLNRATGTEALAAAHLQRARAARTPDLSLTGGVRRLEEAGGTGLLVGLETTLPLWNQGRGEIEAAHRELEASNFERRATELELQARLSIAEQRLRNAAATYDTLVVMVQPARQQLVQELLQGYRAGRSSYLDFVAEQRNLLETELALIDAQADLLRAQVRLQLLTGTGLFAPQEDR